MVEALPKLSRLTKVPLRTVWNDEARLFTPWLELEENLDLLAESLGLPTLRPKSREHAVGRYVADLVCEIGDTNTHLLIENQIEVSDHRHLGQILTYVAGLEQQELDVRYVAWLAEDFRDEHRAALEWLNQRLDTQIGFFACRIEVWQIGQSDRAPRFDVVVEPSQLAPAPMKARVRGVPEGADVDRVAYWGAFADLLRKRKVPVKLRDEPPRIGYYSFTLNAKLGIYIYVFRDVNGRRIGAYVGLYGPAPLARMVFDLWRSESALIESEFGGDLEWREMEADKIYRIQVPSVAADPQDESKWAEQHIWLADKLERLLKVFDPRTKALPSREELLASVPIPSPASELGTS